MYLASSLTARSDQHELQASCRRCRWLCVSVPRGRPPRRGDRTGGGHQPHRAGRLTGLRSHPVRQVRQEAPSGGPAALRRRDVRGQWPHLPHVPQQADRHVHAGGGHPAPGPRPERPALSSRWSRRRRRGNEPDHRTRDGPDRDPAASRRRPPGRPHPQERHPQPGHADDDEHAGAGSAADVRHPRARFAVSRRSTPSRVMRNTPGSPRRWSWSSSRSSSRRMRASSPRRR